MSVAWSFGGSTGGFLLHQDVSMLFHNLGGHWVLSYVASVESSSLTHHRPYS